MFLISKTILIWKMFSNGDMGKGKQTNMAWQKKWKCHCCQPSEILSQVWLSDGPKGKKKNTLKRAYLTTWRRKKDFKSSIQHLQWSKGPDYYKHFAQPVIGFGSQLFFSELGQIGLDSLVPLMNCKYSGYVCIFLRSVRSETWHKKGKDFSLTL